MKCREQAGILFHRPCPNAATRKCQACQKPICGAHLRIIDNRDHCISCVRTQLRDKTRRGSLRDFEDDEYFFWMYDDSDGFEDTFVAADFAIFEEGTPDFESSHDSDWVGS